MRSLDFGICVGGPGCVFSEVVQEFIKSGGEDRWLSECQGQNSSFSVFERARASRAREFEATAGNALLLLLQSSPPFLLGLISVTAT